MFNVDVLLDSEDITMGEYLDVANVIVNSLKD